MVLRNLIQVVIAAGGCVALWRLWGRFAREQVGVTIVAMGFAGRAVLGVLLFWTSWLRLPLGRSLQIEGGLWFFGLDGLGYYSQADRWISTGLSAILFPDQVNASYIWVELLALTRIFAGTSTAVALLLNLASFLGTACIIAYWGRRHACERNAKVTLVLMSFCPSLVLWSTQPLKETFFIFLVVASILGLRMLIEAGDSGTTRDMSGAVALVVISLHLIGGIRWYYAVILWLLFLPTAVWSGLARRVNGMRTALLSVGTFFAAGLALAANRPVPFGEAVVGMFRVPTWFFVLLSDARVSFETSYESASLVKAGPVTEALPHSEVLARGIMMVVPRFVASPLGLATAGGGKGLWFFAELDTLFFVGTVIVATVIIRDGWPVGRAAWPLVAFLLVLFVSALPILYAVDNFGTLLRFREMWLLPIMLLPLAMPDKSGARQVPSIDVRFASRMGGA